MNNTPLISIVIPAYNAEKTIRKTVESVLSQTYKNFELIIVDDNSKDKTVLIIKNFTDERITLHLNKNNLGFEGNWNKALSKARGKYIKLLPDDDIILPKALKLQMEVLEKYSNIILVGSKRNIINEQDKIIMTRGVPLSRKLFCNYKEAIRSIVRYGTNPIGEPGSTLFRASVLKAVPSFDGQYPHFIDLDFYSKILRHGDYYFIKEPLSNFRIWNRSYSVSNKNDNFNESIKFFEKIVKENSFITVLDILICKINIYKNKFLKYLFYFFVSKYYK